MSGLSFSLFRFTLRPLEPLYLPARNKGNILRGALGTMLRRLSCHPQCPGATRCELRQTCPYAQLFEPGAPPGAPALRNYEAIPRPFVFRPPLEETTRYAHPLSFSLVMVGRSVEYLPHVIVTFSQLAADGFGLNRAKMKLERVEQSEKLIYDGSTGVMCQPSPPQLPTPYTLHPTPSSQLIVRFLTPTHLVFQETTVRNPEFHHIIRRLRDRLNALATFYGEGPLELDFQGLGQRAERVRCVRRELQWEDRSRVSSKNRRRHELGGFVGRCEFEGDMDGALDEFLPLLAMGQLAHVGKHAAWGNGWFECEVQV